MQFILRLLAPAVSVLIIAHFAPNVTVASFPHAIVAALVIGLLNSFIKPILELISLPITFLTLGLFMLVINGIIIMLASSILEGFQVDGWVTAILFSLILSVLNSFLYGLINKIS